MAYYLAIKRKKLIIYTALWMDLKNTIPMGKTPISTGRILLYVYYCMIPFDVTFSK
jgi:hypothetical protein